MTHAQSSVFRPSWLVLFLCLLIVACAPEEPGGDGGGQSSDEPVIWDEDDDENNANPWDAEQVSVDWTTTLEIRGSASSCDFDSDEDWPWTGDEDSYQVEVPADGYLEAILSWESTMDLDLLVYFQPPGNSAVPDEQLAQNDDSGPESYLFDDEASGGDDVVFTVACASGGGGDYILTIGWES